MEKKQKQQAKPPLAQMNLKELHAAGAAGTIAQVEDGDGDEQ